jgi:hypothetical protein
MTQTEALKLALEAITQYLAESPDPSEEAVERLCDAASAARKALAQPEQEPVAWIMPDGKTVNKWGLKFYGGQAGEPLYTTPQQRTWVGLTDEERDDLLDNYITAEGRARAIEAKLKQKNMGNT